MFGKLRFALIASLLLASTGFIVLLGRSVASDLETLSTAQNDNISWSVAQLEVELLRVQNAAHEAAQSPQDDLAGFRKRYDIFYSRLSTLSQSALYRSLKNDADTQDMFAAAQDFLRITTPIVDGPDEALYDALSGIQTQLMLLRPQVRELGLAGIQKFAKEDGVTRAEFSQTLIRLAVSGLALVLALVITVLVLLKLYRQGQRFAFENEIMRSRFEAAVNSSLDAVLVIDTSGTIIEFNGSAESVFGYSRAEALGGNMAEMIVPEHMREMHYKGMQRFLDTNEQKVIGAGRVRLEGMRKSGEIFPVELSISLAETGGERVFVSFLRDITHELKAEEDLRNARDKAQESEKAKSDLLTVMSHEMRTPLNGILGSLSLIDQSNLSERQQRHLNSIAVSGELLLSHVNDVLDLSALTVDNALPEQTRFDLRTVVQNAAESLLANAQERGGTLQVNFLSDDFRIVRGHKTALQQCLINLIGNAIKFTGDGVVTIEVEKLPSGDLFEIRVSDTGVGIATENLSRIFDEFVTIDSAFTRENAGTGLGLAITKRLVEAMAGEIEADSVLGEGSLFTIRIPLLCETPIRQKPSVTHETLIPLSGEGRRALVVDDNEINRMILTDMLTDLHFIVTQVENGYEAIELARAQQFDVLLLDISMPGIDGIETLKRIAALELSWGMAPAIAVTAHASKKDHDTILQAPFEGILVKPVALPELRAKLGKVLRYDDPEHAQPIDVEGPAGDFIERFGQEAYLRAAQDLYVGVTDLLPHLDSPSHLSPEARQEAHKLSGSAAILGKTEIWTHLQAVENCDADMWSASCHELRVMLQQTVQSES